MRLFDLEKQFALYGSYHSNPINILLHTLFVWPIFFTLLLLFYFTPSLSNFIPIHLYEHSFLVLNFGFLFTLAYALVYVFLDLKAGSFAALICFLCWVSSSFLAQHLGFSLALKAVLAIQLFCWTGVSIGHGVYEKRAPVNLAQGLLMEPFFVLLEVLHILIDYEPYPGFHAKVKATTDAEIKQWQEEKQKKIS